MRDQRSPRTRRCSLRAACASDSCTSSAEWNPIGAHPAVSARRRRRQLSCLTQMGGDIAESSHASMCAGSHAISPAQHLLSRAASVGSTHGGEMGIRRLVSRLTPGVHARTAVTFVSAAFGSVSGRLDGVSVGLGSAMLALAGLGCAVVDGPTPPELARARSACSEYAWQRCGGFESCEWRNERECLAELGWRRVRGGWARFQTERDRATEIDAALRSRTAEPE